MPKCLNYQSHIHRLSLHRILSVQMGFYSFDSTNIIIICKSSCTYCADRATDRHSFFLCGAFLGGLRQTAPCFQHGGHWLRWIWMDIWYRFSYHASIYYWPIFGGAVQSWAELSKVFLVSMPRLKQWLTNFVLFLLVIFLYFQIQSWTLQWSR